MRLGIVLRKWRMMEERTLRDVAAEIGISNPTLSQIEGGKGANDSTLAAILLWLIGKQKAAPDVK